MSPSQFPFKSSTENINATLVFFDVLDHPLTIDELKKLIPGNQIHEEKLLKYLNTNNNIQLQEKYYCLKGRENLIEKRKEQDEVSENLWRKTRKILPLMQIVPFIKLIAVCNTLAFGNPNKNSDIDLFIITAHNRIFIARAFVTLLFSLLGMRRHGKKIAERFCLSFYVSEKALNLEKIALQKDIYLIYWIKTLQPIFGEKTWIQFLKQNNWMKKYFFDYPNKMSSRNMLRENNFFLLIRNIQEWLLNNKFGDWLENKLEMAQKKRHQRKLPELGPDSSVVISKNMLKFHNVDKRKEYSNNFYKKLKELNQ